MRRKGSRDQKFIRVLVDFWGKGRLPILIVSVTICAGDHGFEWIDQVVHHPAVPWDGRRDGFFGERERDGVRVVCTEPCEK